MTENVESAIAFRDGYVFRKTGCEIKATVAGRIMLVEESLSERNAHLERFIDDRELIRSYMIRSCASGFRRRADSTLSAGNSDLPIIRSEVMADIRRTCERIAELEEERRTLKLVVEHLDDDRIFKLDPAEMERYGFGGEADGA